MSSLFDKQKALKLSKVDLSRKGSVDEPIVEFLKKLGTLGLLDARNETGPIVFADDQYVN